MTMQMQTLHMFADDFPLLPARPLPLTTPGKVLQRLDFLWSLMQLQNHPLIVSAMNK